MRLHIVSDGKPYSAQVVNDQGQVVENVTKIDWSYDHESGGSHAVITLDGVSIESPTSTLSPPIERLIEMGVL